MKKYILIIACSFIIFMGCFTLHTVTLPVSVYAQTEQTLETAGSDISIVAADPAPTESEVKGEETAEESSGVHGVNAIIEFIVLWSVIYCIIKYVRYRLDKKKNAWK